MSNPFESSWVIELGEGKKAMPQSSREVRSELEHHFCSDWKASTVGTDVTAVPLNDKAWNPAISVPAAG
jgi:hypothetical protein